MASKSGSLTIFSQVLKNGYIPTMIFFIES